MNDHELKRAFETMTETVRLERVEDRVRERLAVKEERKLYRKRIMTLPHGTAMKAFISEHAVPAVTEKRPDTPGMAKQS